MACEGSCHCRFESEAHPPAERVTARLARAVVCIVLAAAVLLAPSPGWPQLSPGSMEVRWSEGSPDCGNHPQPPLQIHQYNARTYILRENLCTTFEAPFMYLLLGSARALLIDTGDVADPKQMPLAATVTNLLPGEGAAKLPLLVVHTHRHFDHRAADPQFTRLPNVQVVGYTVASVRDYYGFPDWPIGLAQISLGDRTLDVMPTPGHNETEVSFYDRNTGLFISGDFLLPGRLLIDDARADLASAQRVAAFIKDRPVTFVLGGHIEMDTRGDLFAWGSRYHPHEHVLQMTKDDLLALPAAVRSFNGFYTVRGHFVMMNSMRILSVEGIGALLVLIVLATLLVKFIRRRRRRGGDLHAAT